MLDLLKRLLGFGPSMESLLKREIAQAEMSAYYAQREIEYQEASKSLALVRIQRAKAALAEMTPITRSTPPNAPIQPPRHP